MNTSNDIIAAIDIGTTKIVAIVGRMNEFGRLEILGIGKTQSDGVKRGMVINIELTVNGIRSAVQKAEEISGYKINNAYVGIVGQHISSRGNSHHVFRENLETEISREEVEKLTQAMYNCCVDDGEVVLHVLPQSYIVDTEQGVKNPVGMFGKKLGGNFHLVFGQMAAIKNIHKCVNRVGIKVDGLILEPLASSHAVLTEDEKEIGVAMVDIGGGTTDIAIYYDGIIRHTAVIPFGGYVVTTDIKQGCGITESNAELLKIKCGSALAEKASKDIITISVGEGRMHKEISFQSLAHIIQARMTEIIGAVSYKIEESGYADKLGAGIVLTGGGALLKNLPQLVAHETGCDVRIGYPNQYMAANTSEEINNPAFSTGVGLLLEGLEQMKTAAISTSANTKKQNETEEKKNNGGFFKKIIQRYTNTANEFFEIKDSKM